MKKEEHLAGKLFEGCMTVPNLLSVIRIILVPVFAYFFMKGDKILAISILIASGLTDFFDGKIARRFNQVSALGKVLDPVADKITMLTIAVMMIILFRRAQSPVIRAAGYVFIVFIVKELIFVVGGALMIAFGIRPGAAEIWGKVATFVFYLVMIAILFIGPEVGAFAQIMPEAVAMILVCISALCTVIAFISYLPAIKKQVKERFSKD
ncbi:MAG: CDP-alcohol phosphatidyltransferase family protein [Clostridia bacterium]|nr:CDP-alcohol phosphatidyltransferase family protein [Clostridia bacterium]